MTLASVIVPTRNSAATLEACLFSIRAQTHPDLELVVVDNSSSDNTKLIGERLADVVIDTGPERSAQRNAGGRAARGAVLFFVDSDMCLEPDVVAQAVAEIEAGADQVVIPERSFGDGFWSGVKAFERSLYLGDDTIEAARAFSARAWNEVDGYDERIVAGPEDWDMDQRVRELGGARSRTRAFIDHDEGHLTFGGRCARSATTASPLRPISGAAAAAACRQASPLPTSVLAPMAEPRRPADDRRRDARDEGRGARRGRGRGSSSRGSAARARPARFFSRTSPRAICAVPRRHARKRRSPRASAATRWPRPGRSQAMPRSTSAL